jgi:predicted dehydrogenase
MAWEESGNQRRPLGRNPKEPGMIATRNVFERTLEAFARGTLPPATGEDGRDVLEVIAAAYHSATTGRRVQLDSDEVRNLSGMHMGALREATV